uniref:Subtilisin inhibitor 1 n=1 Tax=Triticum urartu TaxID=4572 RepID=A0A8R7UR19_TRIUA
MCVLLSPCNFSIILPWISRSSIFSAEMGDAKSSWPELLGAPSEVAKQKILSDRPDVRVFVVPVGNNVTGDFNDKRVRVFVNTRGDVARVPNIG